MTPPNDCLIAKTKSKQSLESSSTETKNTVTHPSNEIQVSQGDEVIDVEASDESSVPEMDVEMFVDNEGYVQIHKRKRSQMEMSSDSTTSLTNTSSSSSDERSKRKKVHDDPRIFMSNKTGVTYKDTPRGLEMFNEDQGLWVLLQPKDDKSKPSTSTGGKTQQGKN